ncbi:MAG: small basic protein [Planctomycetota bacterium]|nr:MAG: small basic protein [Planctomycetota bacterium]
MTIDKTLKVARGLVRSRSVLTRAERLTRLKDADRWHEGDSPVGLPKVRVYKLSMKKKKKKEAEEGAAGAAAPAAGAAAAPAAGAAAKKPATPAKK